MNLLFTNCFHKKHLSKVSKIANAMTIEVYTTIDEINKTNWNELTKGQSVFFQVTYLKALELNLPAHIKPVYHILYEDQTPVAIALYQVYSFKDKSSFQIPAQSKTTNFAENAIANALKNYLSCSNRKVVVLGNLLHTGDCAFISIDASKNDAYLSVSLNAIKKSIKYDAFVLKDTNIKLPDVRMQSFYTQPCMVLTIHEDWKTFDDYRKSLLPKYKKRISNTNNKNTQLIRKELSLEEIEENKQVLYELYKQVYEHSETKAGIVNIDYFYDLKNSLKNDFVVVAYFLENELVAFSSAFITKEVLETGFVGFHYELNKQYKLYQTLLFEYVEKAILTKSKVLALGRTGLTIKSSLGAVPIDFPCCIHFENVLYSHLAKTILNNIKIEHFEQRHPFKETGIN